MEDPVAPVSHVVVETSAGPVSARDPELAAAIEAMLAYEIGRRTEEDLTEVIRLDLLER